MKMFLTTILLCVAIWFTAFGVHTNNFILVGIAGAFIGGYNAMMYKQD